MQICTNCKISKDFFEFHKNSSSKKGYRTSCRECVKEKDRKYHIENRDKRNKLRREYRLANTQISRMCSSLYQKANPEKRKKYNKIRQTRLKTGTLSKDLVEKLYELQKGVCACCNKPLKDLFEKDHIIPLALGGLNVDENIQLLTPLCNSRKGISLNANTRS